MTSALYGLTMTVLDMLRRALDATIRVDSRMLEHALSVNVMRNELATRIG
jgi:hypothetical protein